MIESISIATTATFDTAPEQLTGLSKFNFLFGSNGTGKTTISRLIADASKFPSCKVTWKAGIQLEPLVYNHDFVNRNFHQSEELKGVFTLGEQQAGTLAKISTMKTEKAALSDKIVKLTQGLEGTTETVGKKAELEALVAGFTEKCWEQKKNLDEKFEQAFTGVRGDSKKFMEKVLAEKASNTATLLSLQELEKKAESIFGKTPTSETTIESVDTKTLLDHESNPILKKKVIGKEDIDITAMIKKLGNSDWVREGQAYYEANKNVCPFCQQNTTESFSEGLKEYFDDTFMADQKAIDGLTTNYATDATRLQNRLSELITTPPKFLDAVKMKSEKELLDSKVILNKQHIAKKKKEPSQTVELESLANVLNNIELLIGSANLQITDHNRLVENLPTERKTLTAQVWMYVIEEMKSELMVFKSKREGLEKAIANMNEQIRVAQDEIGKKNADIRALEKTMTSIQPSIDGINGVLSKFGFRGFKIAKAENGVSYKLVRSDGSDAKTTLSEGEKTFVAFLYFYHLLKGSTSDSGISTDRIVVFDDPVSSLDSDILFIVGSLIKGLYEEVKSGTGTIKQVFVLTHNVYFHKEVTFDPKRKTFSKGEVTYWMVRRSEMISKVEKYESNPIKSSYELLWAEVRNADRSNLTLPNTLRRILENYFKILGGIEYEDICKMFDGPERVICRSLLSWVQVGSHFALDDMHASIDGSMVESYLGVFKAIFEKSNHIAHYEMMMNPRDSTA